MTGDARYQMLWDCPGCDTAGLLALDHKFCPVCGTPQDPKLRYFPSDEQKVAVEDHPYHGADKVCGACDTPNVATAGFCTACGSAMDDAKAAARREDRVVADGAADAGDNTKAARDEAKQKRQAAEERRVREAAGQPAEPSKPRRGMGAYLGLGCGAIVAIAALGCVGFFLLSWLLQTQDTLTVSGHTWDRRVDVEVLGPVKKSDWKDEVPAAASDVVCRSEKKDTKKVPDGEDCQMRKKDLGDGTFTEVRECTTRYRTEDVFGEKCSYTVVTWSKARSEQAAGADLSPRWPQVTLTPAKEREGKRHETYTLALTDSKGQGHTCDLAEPAWRSYAQGSKVQASFGGLTGLIDCGSLAPAR
jgi:hypothetical protein